MKTQTDNKSEIIKTRTGGLGSSDAKMVISIGKNGKVSETQKKRLAIMLGLDEQVQFSTNATDYGNYIENCVFEALKGEYPTAVSNPFTKHELFSAEYGFDIFNHIDFEVENGYHIAWFECKAVNDNLTATIEKYKDQLMWHQMIGREKARNLKKDFTLYLVHYQTSDKDSEFDASKIVIERIENEYSNPFISGFEVIKSEIQNFTYEKSEELSSYCLPAEQQKELEQIYINLKEIETLNKKVEEFKARMHSLMEENNVKSIDNDLFKITIVAGSESMGFDAKRFEKENPELYRKYLTKKTVRNSYPKITLK